METKKYPSHPEPHEPEQPSPSGFSLVEVVLALGVVAFAIVAIMGMLPVAMNSALESKRESRAAFIANVIKSNLCATRFNAAQPSGNSTLTLDLNSSGNLTLAFDDNGFALGTVSDSNYQTGASSPANATYLARITHAPVSGTQGLATVQIEVSTPAAAARAKRQIFPFVTLIADRSVAASTP